jgi:hypothetical protein
MLFARVDKDGRKGGGLRSRKTIKKDMGRGRIVFVIAGGIFRKLFFFFSVWAFNSLKG